MVVVVVIKQEYRVCLTYTYIHNMHRVFVILRICHVIVLDKITYDHAY